MMLFVKSFDDNFDGDAFDDNGFDSGDAMIQGGGTPGGAFCQKF